MHVTLLLIVWLEVEVTDAEIKKAVWNCGKNKSLGPDGINFEFVRKFWDVIGGDVCRAIKIFFRSGSFPKGCNPSFITLIPKVNDAKFVKDFRPISLIGCQYKIVGKILANRLSSVIGSLVSKEQSTFIHGRQILDGPLILSEWIKGCLVSSSASILVNGSPTQEFYFEQGLHQGDPLSPFLFLLVMEALHISFVRAMYEGFFKGISVGSRESVHISHLFYADDAVFIREWREENLRHLVSILQCFYLALGLRINIYKCSIMGVGGVTNAEVNRGAQMIGCEASKTPFKYLGIMVGGQMNRLHSWDVVIDKVMAILSKWKAKTLSIGGRFTLTKSVLSTIPLYYFSLFKVPIGVLKRLESCRSNFFRGVEPGKRKVAWFSWDSVVASKDVGDLGMSSFFAMNCALLFKWIWRFKVQPDAMWVSVIKAIHIRLGNVDRDVQKVGNGSDSLFWLENWLGEGSLDVKYPRLFSLEENKEVSLRDKVHNGLLHGFRKTPRGGAEGVQMEEVSNLIDSLELVEDHDKWVWNLDEDGVFKVSSTRRYIDEGLCDMEGANTRWVNVIPLV
ncbi:RNA-directed DNA polymerase, eukaryota [Tanacetum coccineum]